MAVKHPRVVRDKYTVLCDLTIQNIVCHWSFSLSRNIEYGLVYWVAAFDVRFYVLT